MVQAKLLAYAQDLGGARAVLPVIRRLLDDQAIQVLVLARSQAERLFREHGLSFTALASCGYPVPLAREDARLLVGRVAPDVILAATSHPKDPSNGHLIGAGREMGIPTIAVLDHWKGHERLQQAPAGALSFAPDILGVMDQAARALYIAQGLPPNRVSVTGHPYLEQLHGERRLWTDPERRIALKRKAGLDPSRRLVLFCSETVHDHPYHEGCRKTCQPLSQVPAGGKRLFDRVAEAVAGAALITGTPLDLAIRPHPYRQDSVAGIRVLGQDSLSDVEAIAVSDIVLGLSSMPLIESAILGKPTAALACFDGWHPTRAYFDQSAWESQPFFTVLQDIEELKGFLAAALAGEAVRSLTPAHEQDLLIGATGRCLGLITAGLAIPRIQGASAR